MAKKKDESRLRRRAIRQLSPAELKQVAGGQPAPETTTEGARCDTDAG